MIRSFTFLVSRHQMLHNHIMDFFDRIEFETGPFDNSFFHEDFLSIVDRHPIILRERCVKIYSVLSRLSQNRRTLVCTQIRDSNRIDEICNGNIIPIILDSSVKGIKSVIRILFIDLYSQVLDGVAFREEYATTLRNHFNEFRQKNCEITICPICGIDNLKMGFEETRDQYDHYLPKSKYPFSSVNFENLVLGCTDCNSLSNKSDKDIVKYSTGLNFFPYDYNHKGVEVSFSLIKDSLNLIDIEWEVDYYNVDGNVDKIKSWRDIYKIDTRYIGLVKGKIDSWFKHYWNYKTDANVEELTEHQIDSSYFLFLRADRDIFLDFIRLPALQSFLDNSMIAEAERQARLYV